MWGAPCRPRPAATSTRSCTPPAESSLAALRRRRRRPGRLRRPGAGRRRRSTRAGFIVSLEMRHSAVTEHADVVLPVAPAAEKAGRYVTWEGRRRPFDLTITGTGAMSDGRVLTRSPRSSTSTSALPTVEAGARRAAAPGARPSTRRVPRRRVARAAADAGRRAGAAGHLARAARRRPRCRTATSTWPAPPSRRGRGSVAGDRCRARRRRRRRVTVGTDARRAHAAGRDRRHARRVVWLPTNARGCAVRATLGAVAGDRTARSATDAPPVVGGAAMSAASPPLACQHRDRSQNLPGFGDQPFWLVADQGRSASSCSSS